MKTEEIDFLDWLHKIRRESEAERKRKGIDGVEWLRMLSRKSRLRRRGGPTRRSGRALPHHQTAR